VRVVACGRQGYVYVFAFLAARFLSSISWTAVWVAVATSLAFHEDDTVGEKETGKLEEFPRITLRPTLIY
jgi:hypothetical protein